LAVIDAGDPRQASVQRRLVGFDQPDWKAGVEQRHGNSRPHGAGADDGGLVERADGSGGGDAVHPGRCALREECMPEALRLGSLHQLEEGLPLDGEPFVEGPSRRRDCVHRAEGRWKPGPLGFEPGTGGLAQRSEVGFVERDVAGSPWWLRRCVGGGCEIHRGCQRVTVHHEIEQRHGGQLLRRHRIAVRDHVDRPSSADQSR
jgi:hypothetical protein